MNFRKILIAFFVILVSITASEAKWTKMASGEIELTQKEKDMMEKIEADFDKFDDLPSDITEFKSDTTMPDGRKEIYSFHYEIEQRDYNRCPVRTNSVYFSIDLTDTLKKTYRTELLENLKIFHRTMQQLINKELDLFANEKELKDTCEYSNDYEMVKVDNYVFYPNKDMSCC